MSASALSSLRQNLEKSDILGKLMNLHAVMKEYFSVVLLFFCLFQHKLHQSTNTFSYHENGSTVVARSVCSDPD